MVRYTVFFCLCMTLVTSLHAEIIDSGSISASGGEITATDPWESGDFSLDYTVDRDDVAGEVTYSYVFDVPTKKMDYWVFEVDTLFDSTNLLSTSGPGTDPTGSPSIHSTSENPGMPNDIFGYKWSGVNSKGTVTFTVVTNTLPTEGSFYALGKGKNKGNDIYAHNTGLNGGSAKIPVPGIVIVPEPGSLILLLGLAVVVIICFMWRDRRKGKQ